MGLSKTKDMTVGSPMKLILGFAVPLMFGNIFQQFYSMVDTIIVGRYLGKDALAGVGSTGALNFLILGFCLGICSGFSIPIAQRFGSKNIPELKKFVGNIIWLATAFAVVFTLVTALLCRQMLVLTNTPDNIINYSYNYFFVILCGIPATILYNILSAMLRALGDSKTPVMFLVMASIINIVLDIVLVVYIPLGVAGAGIATVVSQGISGIACLIFIMKKFPILHISKHDLKPNLGYMIELCENGVPMGLQYSITAIGSVILQTSVNSLGSIAVASVTAASKLSMFFTCAFDALGVAMSTYGGQNVGARKYNRLTSGLYSGIILGSIYSVIALIIILFSGKTLLTLFVSASETQIINDAYKFLFTNVIFFVLLTGVNVIRLLIQGMGYGKVAIFSGIFEMIARSFIGFFIVPNFGFYSACYGNPLAWLLADLFLVPAFFLVLKHIKTWGHQ